MLSASVLFTTKALEYFHLWNRDLELLNTTVKLIVIAVFDNRPNIGITHSLQDFQVTYYIVKIENKAPLGMASMFSRIVLGDSLF